MIFNKTYDRLANNQYFTLKIFASEFRLCFFYINWLNYFVFQFVE